MRLTAVLVLGIAGTIGAAPTSVDDVDDRQEADRPRPARPRHGAGVQGGAPAAARRRRPPGARRAGAATASRTTRRRRRSCSTSSRSTRTRAPTTTRCYLLGESLFQARDYYSARHYLAGGGRQEHRLEAGAAGAAAAGRDRAAHGRLRERRCLPDAPRRTCRSRRWSRRVPYVRGKYLYFRSRLDDALRRSSRRSRRPTPTTSRRATSWRPSRSSAATWPARHPAYDASAQAAGAGRRQQGHSGSVAAGDRPHPLRAVAVRQGDRGLPRRSRASRSTGRTRCASRPGRTSRPRTGSAPIARSTCCCSPIPTRRDAPDLRLLEGNLHLRMNNFYLASDAFSQGARRVRADPPPAAAGHRQVADRSRPTSTRWSARASTSSTSARSSPPPPPSG